MQEKVEYLRSECEDLKRREATYMEACQRDTELRVQSAIAPYRHLPQEIESLKTVLELRNQEIHELRHRNLDLQSEVSSLDLTFSLRSALFYLTFSLRSALVGG